MKNYNRFLLFFVPVLCILSFILCLKRSYFSDEGWYLFTLSRMMDGDILYRDTISHITPLGYYIGLIFTYIFGIEIWSLRIATLLIFLCNILLTFRIFQKLSLGIPYQVAAAMLNMIYCPPGLAGSGMLHTPLGILFYLICFDLALLWFKEVEETERKNKDLYTIAILAGIFTGLAFVSKQNFGVYAFTAFFLCIMSKRPFLINTREHLRHLLIISFSFISIIVIFLAPTYFHGGFSHFIESTFLSVQFYAEYASISYWYQIKVLVYYIRQTITVADPIAALENIRNIFVYTLFLLPPVTFGLLLGSIFLSKQENRRRTLYVLFFAVFGFICAYPRFDLSHVGSTVPMLTIALLYAYHQLYETLTISWKRLNTIWRHMIRTSVVFWTLIWVLNISNEFYIYITGPYRMSTVMHFRGLIVPDAWHKEIQTTSENLTIYFSDSQAFILHFDAGLYYLTTGMRNIVPFDYWARVMFGLNGQQQVIDTIKRGQIQIVYLIFLENHSPLAAVQLEHFILDNMIEDKTWEGPGHIYRMTPPSP